MWEGLSNKEEAIEQLLNEPWSKGQDLSQKLRQELRSMWATEPVYREKLTRIIVRLPCAEFQRPFLRSVESSWFDKCFDGVSFDHVASVNWDGWMEHDETLTNVLFSIVKKRAGLFNQPTPALFYCAAWARHFDGGEEAWRMFACIWKRLMRCSKHSGLAVHLVTCHSYLSVEEQSKVNQHLHSLDCDGF